MRKAYVCAIAAVSGMALISQAASVIQWDFTGASGNEASIAATTLGPDMQGGSVSRGIGLTAVSGANTFSAGGWTGGISMDPNDYFQFTMTPNAGFMYSIDSLTYKVEPGGPHVWALRSDADGYTGNLDSWSYYASGVVTQTVNLAANLDFQDVTDTTTFRLFGWDTCGAPTPVSRLRSDSPGISIEGTTSAIPEPTTIVSFFLGAALCLARVLRKRR